MALPLARIRAPASATTRGRGSNRGSRSVGPDEDAEETATPTRQFSLLEITSGLPDDSREADERAAEPRLRDLRGRVKAARGGDLGHGRRGGGSAAGLNQGRALLRQVRDQRGAVSAGSSTFGWSLAE